MKASTAIWRPNIVRIGGLPRGVRVVGLRRNEDRKNSRGMTRRVEIFQIECVVPDLVVVRETKLTLAALELDRKNGRPGNQHRVYSAAKSWHVEFQEEPAGKTVQSAAQNIELFLPR